MLKKNFILKNLSTKNNLHIMNIIIRAIVKNKKFLIPVFSKNNIYFFNLKCNLC